MPDYRIAIVGPRASVRGFSLLGADVIPASSPQEAVTELHRLKTHVTAGEHGDGHQTYAIVFITEDLASQISAEDEKLLAQGALPAIIPLPSHRGTSGYGLARLKRIVERAVGSDILA
jgi:V/A-type H+/Na+-transporting ATPase subunit F